MPALIWLYLTAVLNYRTSVSCVALAEALETVSHDRLTRMLQADGSGQRLLELACRTLFSTPFVAGLYRLPLGHEAHTAGSEVTPRCPKAAFLYVNRGLGTFGLPVRLGVPPEITVLTLRAVG